MALLKPLCRSLLYSRHSKLKSLEKMTCPFRPFDWRKGSQEAINLAPLRPKLKLLLVSKQSGFNCRHARSNQQTRPTTAVPFRHGHVFFAAVASAAEIEIHVACC